MARLTEITPVQARKLVLEAQGLDRHVDNSLESIRKLSYVQIDSISVTERSHHHVFLTRNPAYKQSDLDQMMNDRTIFEYWSHAAAFLPMEDYRFSLYPKGEILKADKFWFEKDKKVMRHVLRRIRKEGPLQSKDFANPNKDAGTWYDWKPTKVALQQLFMEGRIMVSGRQGFQKVYDLTERVLPSDVDTRKPTQKGYYSYLVDRAVSSQGLIAEEEIRYLRKGSGEPVKRILTEKVRKKELVKCRVSGRDQVYYALPEQLQTLSAVEGSPLLHILNPFDNLVIQRKRMSDLFDFDYQIECYVPEPKRKYGYYTLPVLFGDEFVARLDAKADRKNNVLNVSKLWFEEGFEPHNVFLEAFSARLEDFARFCGTQEVRIGKVFPEKFAAKVRKVIA